MAGQPLAPAAAQSAECPTQTRHGVGGGGCASRVIRIQVGKARSLDLGLRLDLAHWVGRRTGPVLERGRELLGCRDLAHLSGLLLV